MSFKDANSTSNPTRLWELHWVTLQGLSSSTRHLFHPRPAPDPPRGTNPYPPSLFPLYSVPCCRWHQPLLNALVQLPPLSPGDAVFWHTDLVHCESDSKDWVKRDYAGMHLSTLPVCEANSMYVRAQREAFLVGRRPLAFEDTGASGVESVGIREENFRGRAVAQDLTRGGERMMGLRGWKKEHHNAALALHHQLLDLPYGW
ncbi:unnamed protein product [Choristocarpus tenellus]